MFVVDTLSLLFPTYPRDAGNWSRTTLKSASDLRAFIALNNGINNCGVAVYDDTKTIDKIFFDFDGKAQGLASSQRTYDYLLDQRVPVIPVASGEDGVHLHALFPPVPFTPESYQLLQLSTNYILAESAAYSDPQCVGDLRRLCRIPNTLRPPQNKSYCTYLPPDGFTSMSWRDIVGHCKQTHEYGYRARRGKTLEFFSANSPLSSPNSLPPVVYSVPREIGSPLLERLLRPCLFAGLRQSEPKQYIRVAATIDLLELGFSQAEIHDFYREFRWRDYKPDTTAYQIGNIAGKSYKRFGCYKLRRGYSGEKCGECPRPQTITG